MAPWCFHSADRLVRDSALDCSSVKSGFRIKGVFEDNGCSIVLGSDPVKAVYGEAYVEKLIDARSYDAMATLGAHIEAAAPLPGEPALGLPIPLFVYVEALTWLAQSVRSGAWTYFEATPLLRQEAMCQGLAQLGGELFMGWYCFGMRHWMDSSRMRELDHWLDESEQVQEAWLASLLDSHRARVKELLCARIEQVVG